MAAESPRVSIFSRSLRVRVALGVIVPLALILGALTAIEYSRHRAAVFNDLSYVSAQTGQVIKNSLRHTMLSRDPESLQHMLDAIGENESLRQVYLIDTQGRVVFSPGQRDVGRLLSEQDPTCQPCHKLPAESRPHSVVVTLPSGERVFRSMTTFENEPECQKCHAADQRLIGVLLTDISTANVEAPLAADMREKLLWSIATIVITLVVVNLVMSRMVTGRLEVVAGTLAAFGRGQLGARLDPGTPDEIGQVAAAFNEMGQRLQSEEQQKLALAAQRQELVKQLITAQEAERQRMARDLHDGLGQELAGLSLGLEAVERLSAERPEAAQAHVRRLRAGVAELADRVYDLILALRPSVLDDLGLAPALRSQAERSLGTTGIHFELDASRLTRRLPPEVETALFRTYQEALTNVVRHSGARQVRLSLAICGDDFEGEVWDDGHGFDLGLIRPNGHRPKGLGLLGMQERVVQVGGALDIQSQPGRGTCLRIRIPLPHANGG